MTREDDSVSAHRERSRSVAILDLDTSINMAKDYRCFLGVFVVVVFGRHIKLSDSLPVDKRFLIIITLTGTRSLYCERAGWVPGPKAGCWITAWRPMPGHHTMAQAGELLGESHFGNVFIPGQEIHSPSSKLVHF